MPSIVYGSGRTPNHILLIGEAPGREESSRGEPFVGKSGLELSWYLWRNGRHIIRHWYRTNVVKDYIDGNPDPTPALIAKWTPYLLEEVHQCNPKLIISVGRFATQWFLGYVRDQMDTCHGIPHRAGAFNAELKSRAPHDCIILPTYHPALGFYDGDARAKIDWDFQQVDKAIAAINVGRSRVYVPADYAPSSDSTCYLDISGADLADLLTIDQPSTIALDTEGTPANPWSIQVCWEPGIAYCLRTSDPTFSVGIDALQSLADSGSLFILHNALYDLEMCRACGLDLFEARIFDTMYALYLLRCEPQGLKPSVWRWLGVRMASYDDVVGAAGQAKQLQYLSDVLSRATPWPKPESELEFKNDGTWKLSKPWTIERRASNILIDYYTTDEGEDRAEFDILKRWNKVSPKLRQLVASELGALPIGTLADIPLARAVDYACCDADMTFQLYQKLVPELSRLDLTRTMNAGMSTLPVFEEMQSNGMPASLSHFEALAIRMRSEMDKLQSKISLQYFDGQPFNPSSPPQTRELMISRGLKGLKRTKKNDVSTGKQSIEYLRATDPAIGLLFDWRERRHIDDSFCKPAINRLLSDPTASSVRCKIKITRVHTRRPAASDPNLLNIPVRSDIGRAVRDCYRLPDDSHELLMAWDLSQIEMRVMADESRDPLMCRMFRDGLDIHKETASRIFRIPIDQVTKKERDPAKTAGFGTLYGISEQGLLIQLKMMNLEGWDDSDTEGAGTRWLLRSWFDQYQGVREYIAKQAALARQTGYARSRSGMYRYIPGIWSPISSVAAEAARIAVSQKIQGTAQDMIQGSMAWLKPRIRAMQKAKANVRWCLQIHDELILRADRKLWPELNELVIEGLTKHSGIELCIPVEAEGHAGTTWAGLKAGGYIPVVEDEEEGEAEAA